MIICKSSDDARRYFTGKSMTYKDVSDGDIGVLFILLNKHVKQAIKAGVISTYTIRMSRKIKSKYKTNGIMKECYFFLNSYRFTQREAISVNQAGFIGFVGWADAGNKSPFNECVCGMCRYNCRLVHITSQNAYKKAN